MRFLYFITLLFVFNSYSNSWLHSIELKIADYYKKPINTIPVSYEKFPVPYEKLEFKITGTRNPNVALNINNNKIYGSEDLKDIKFIGWEGDYKKIDVLLYGQVHNFAKLTDLGNYDFLLQYHPANYDILGNLDYNRPFSDFYSAELIHVKGNPPNVDLILTINGPWKPTISDVNPANFNIKKVWETVDIFSKNAYKSFCDNYIGAHAQISVDKPYGLYFDGKNTKIVTENIVEKLGVNKESAEVTIQKIEFANKNAIQYGMKKINLGDCLGNHSAGVNCEFHVTYQPSNKKLFYSGNVRVWYTTKTNSDWGYLDIPIMINSNLNDQVKGMIESEVSTEDPVFSDTPLPVTFKFFNTSDSSVNNIKVSELLLTYNNNATPVEPKYNNCSTTLAPNSFCEVRAMLAIPKIQANYSLKSKFTYNKGSQVNLSLDVFGNPPF